MMQPITSQKVQRFSGSLKTQTDVLAEETPIALVYNGISHLVLMATPQDLAELALGFSLSEGILSDASQLYDLQIENDCHGVSVQMTIAAARFALLKERRRQMSGRTGCGLCGIDSLSAAMPEIPAVERTNKIATADIQAALQNFDTHQILRQQTGSLHGAAWVENGHIQAAFEDIGRHNALDKLLGYLAKNHINRQNGWILVSSRASYEMVAKTATLGVGALVAVSAATTLAVRVAAQSNITLIGFAKPQQFTVYSGENWLV